MKLRLSLGRKRTQPIPAGLMLLMEPQRTAAMLSDWQRELEERLAAATSSALLTDNRQDVHLPAGPAREYQPVATAQGLVEEAPKARGGPSLD